MMNKYHQKLKDELSSLERRLVEAEAGRQIDRIPTREIKLRIALVKWVLMPD